VVIAIIALLMAILMPALERVRKQAKETVCLSNLKHWGVIYSMYINDNEGYFDAGWYPGIAEDNSMNPENSYAGGHAWPKTLLPFYGDEKLLFCPIATVSLAYETRTEYFAWIAADTYEPSGFWEAKGSYGKNEWCSNPPLDPGEEDDGWNAQYWRTSNVKNTNNIPLIMGCWWAGGFPDDEDEPPEYRGLLGWGGMMRYCIARHGDSVNSCFVDSSARKVGLKQQWELKWHRTFRTHIGPSDDVPCGSTGGWPCWMDGFRRYE
jgi:hypothetical protein